MKSRAERLTFSNGIFADEQGTKIYQPGFFRVINPGLKNLQPGLKSWQSDIFPFIVIISLSPVRTSTRVCILFGYVLQELPHYSVMIMIFKFIHRLKFQFDVFENIRFYRNFILIKILKHFCQEFPKSTIDVKINCSV